MLRTEEFTMLDLLKKYTAVSSVSGNEKELRNLIIDEIKDHTDDLRVDGLGNLIVFKKGKKTPINRTMLDAHMDEIGLIVTTATSDGYLRFSKVGGIDNRVIFGKRVRIGDICGVIGGCAVHLLSSDKRKAIVDADELYIDIGAKSKDEALSLVPAGSVASLRRTIFAFETVLAYSAAFFKSSYRISLTAKYAPLLSAKTGVITISVAGYRVALAS